MTCAATHTKFQPTDEQWKCPRCGTGTEYEEDGQTRDGMIVMDADETCDSDCILLHSKDLVACMRCGGEWTGKRLAALLQRKANLAPCGHCNGTGLVPRIERGER